MSLSEISRAGNELPYMDAILEQIGIVLEEGISPKQKIQQFKITDPFIQHFVYRFGEVIKWGDVKTTSDIKYQVEKLMSEFNKRLEAGHKKTTLFDPSKLDVNQEVENVRTAHPEHYDNIIKIREEKGDDAIRKELGDIINKDKVKILRDWISGTNKTIEDSVQKYLILRTVFDTTTKKDKKTPKPYRYSAVKGILSTIEKDPKNTIKLEKVYEDFLIQDLLKVERFTKIKTKDSKVWVKIPSQNEDKENYKDNVEALMGLSCSIWCTSGKTMAERYLEDDGHFYLLIDESKKVATATMAVRISKDKIQEVRGELDGQDFDPEEQQDVLDDLIREANLDKFDIYDWINKSRKNRSLDPVILPEVKDFKSKLQTHLQSLLENYFAENDVDEDEIKETFVDNYLSELSFPSNRPVVGYEFNTVQEFAKEMGDYSLEEFVGDTYGDAFIEGYGAHEYPDIEDGDKILIANSESTESIYEELVENNKTEGDEYWEEIKEEIDVIKDNNLKSPYGFVEDLRDAGHGELDLESGDIYELHTRVIISYQGGVESVYLDAFYTQSVDHVKEYGNLLGNGYLREDPYLVSFTQDLVEKDFIESLKESVESDYYKETPLLGTFKDYVYDEINYDAKIVLDHNFIIERSIEEYRMY